MTSFNLLFIDEPNFSQTFSGFLRSSSYCFLHALTIVSFILIGFHFETIKDFVCSIGFSSGKSNGQFKLISDFVKYYHS